MMQPLLLQRNNNNITMTTTTTTTMNNQINNEIQQLPKYKMHNNNDNAVIKSGTIGIQNPHNNDVLWGKGNLMKCHPGNEQFWQFMQKHCQGLYRMTRNKNKKWLPAYAIVNQICNLDNNINMHKTILLIVYKGQKYSFSFMEMLMCA